MKIMNIEYMKDMILPAIFYTIFFIGFVDVLVSIKNGIKRVLKRKKII